MSDIEEAKTSAPSSGEPPAQPGKYEQITLNVYAEATDSIISLVEGDFDLADAAKLATHLMEFIRGFPEVPGEEKKSIVKKVINKIIDDIPMSEGARAALRLGLYGSGLLETVINLIAKAWKKRFDLDGDGTITAEEYKKACSSCFPCCSPKK
jgi:hypothetical protein